MKNYWLNRIKAKQSVIDTKLRTADMVSGDFVWETLSPNQETTFVHGTPLPWPENAVTHVALTEGTCISTCVACDPLPETPKAHTITLTDACEKRWKRMDPLSSCCQCFITIKDEDVSGCGDWANPTLQPGLFDDWDI